MSNINIKNYFIVCVYLTAVLLLITPGSAWWFDHFDADTISHYNGDLAGWDLQTALSNITETGASGNGRLFYADESFSSGNFTFKFAPNTSGTPNHWPRVLFGSASSSGWDFAWIYQCAAGETTYKVGFDAIATGDMQLRVCNNGVSTLLNSGYYYFTSVEGTVYFIVNWDPDGLDESRFASGETINVTIIRTVDDAVAYLGSSDNSITSGYSGFGTRNGGTLYALDWINFQAVEVAPTPTPTPTPAPAPVSEEIILISKSENYIHWQWNKTSVNYTLLDGVSIDLPFGMYVYSGLLANTSHSLIVSWDGVNETVSIVKTDSSYNYFKWLFIGIGLIMVLISLRIVIFSVLAFVIFMFNLAYNFMGYTKMEGIICILLLIVSLILIDFNYGGK